MNLLKLRTSRRAARAMSSQRFLQVNSRLLTTNTKDISISNQRRSLIHRLTKRTRLRITNTLRLLRGRLIRLKTNFRRHEKSSNRKTTIFSITNHARRLLQQMRNLHIRAAKRSTTKNENYSIMDTDRSNRKVRRCSRILTRLRGALNTFSNRFNGHNIVKNQAIRNKKGSLTLSHTLRVNSLFKTLIRRRRRGISLKIINNSKINSILRNSNLANLQQKSGRAALTLTSQKGSIRSATNRLIQNNLLLRALLQMRQHRLKRLQAIRHFFSTLTISKVSNLRQRRLLTLITAITFTQNTGQAVSNVTLTRAMLLSLTRKGMRIIQT